VNSDVNTRIRQVHAVDLEIPYENGFRPAWRQG
jgi:hypothetical protein